MTHEGLDENTEFSRFHPMVAFIYFGLTVGLTMFSMSAIFLVITFILSWIYSLILRGIKALKFNMLMMVTTLIIMAVINTFFTHNGETVLFYINTNRITLEAFIYGISAAVMLISVIIWFSCFNVIMTADKIIYIFGRAAPVLGLTMSMIFRFIPLLKSRFHEISMGQKCFNQEKNTGLMSKARQLVKEISILIAWSLEASIESADSMEARGYGLRGRTSFNLFKFTGRDIALMAYMGILGAISMAACVMRKTTMYFYPKIVPPEIDTFTVIAAICYIMIMALPMIIDIIGEIKWKQYA